MNNVTLFVHIYFVMAIAYNIFSQMCLDLTGRKLAPTDPANGILVVSLVYVVFLLRDQVPLPAFIFLAIIWILVIARFGIFQHLVSYALDSYRSRAAWVAAIAINLFGVLVMGALVIDYMQ